MQIGFLEEIIWKFIHLSCQYTQFPTNLFVGYFIRGLLIRGLFNHKATIFNTSATTPNDFDFLLI